ncbi:MAG: c-type cytochrome [Candidatus Wallbacteria bacterium]|nr:c-type cytochrome [Candidatus Wallbacteria bacterium]
MRRVFPVLLSAALLCFLTVSQARSDSDEVGELKNVQKLKGLAKPELVKVMKGFCAALGKKCDFCHVKGDFSSDDKDNKRTARMMLDLVDTLNEKFFTDPKEARATCYMCHRGDEKPVFAP